MTDPPTVVVYNTEAEATTGMGTAARMTRVRAAAKNAFTEPPSHQEITLVYICRIRMRIYVIKSLNDIYMSNNF